MRVRLSWGQTHVGKHLHTHHGDGLDAEHKGVRRKVPRVGQGVLLPQLGEEILRAGEDGMVVQEVSYGEAGGSASVLSSGRDSMRASHHPMACVHPVVAEAHIPSKKQCSDPPGILSVHDMYLWGRAGDAHRTNHARTDFSVRDNLGFSLVATHTAVDTAMPRRPANWTSSSVRELVFGA